MKLGRPPLRLAAVTLGLASAGCALAEANPYYLGVAQSFSRESNLFRVPSGQPQTDDSLSTTSLLAGIDQPFGRQRFVANATLRHTRFRDNEQLDNNGYALATRLDWETGERLAGLLGATRNRSLARFGAEDGPALTTRNDETSQELVARIRYGLASQLRLEAALSHQTLDYSAPEYAYLNLRQNSVRTGLQYRPSGLLTLGGALRYTRGRFPSAIEPAPGVFQADRFDRRDVDLDAQWTPTGQSTLRLRLSHTRETHDEVASRDVSGVTGALSWDYRPTGKLRFTTEVIRDTGAASAFSQLVPGTDTRIGDNSQLSNTLAVKAFYDATAKIRVEAGVRLVKRDLVDAFALPSGSVSTNEGSDRSRELRLAASYAPARQWLAGCSIARERRTASSSVSYPYSANAVSCSLQFKLQ